jgi:thymidine kinase
MAKLYFYYSAMNAGKTTTLLQSAHNYRERGMRVLIFTPKLDFRAGSGTVASRIGLSAEGQAFERDDDLEIWARNDIARHGKLDCVLVDEAQFLTRAQVWQLSEIVDRLRIPVLCYGLRTDFRGELFDGSQYLLAWADELTEIKTICHTCARVRNWASSTSTQSSLPCLAMSLRAQISRSSSRSRPSATAARRRR